MLTLCRHRLFLLVKPGRRSAVRPSGRRFAVRTAFSGGRRPPRSPPAKGILSLWNPIIAAYGVFICFYSASAATAVVVVASASAVIAAAVEKQDEKKNKKDDAPAVVSVKA